MMNPEPQEELTEDKSQINQVSGHLNWLILNVTQQICLAVA